MNCCSAHTTCRGEKRIGRFFNLLNIQDLVSSFIYRRVDKSLARPGRKKSYSDQTLTFARHSKKKIESLSVQPGLCGSKNLRVGRKMATFQFFFQSGRAKELSAPLYVFMNIDGLLLSCSVIAIFSAPGLPVKMPLSSSNNKLSKMAVIYRFFYLVQ